MKKVFIIVMLLFVSHSVNAIDIDIDQSAKFNINIKADYQILKNANFVTSFVLDQKGVELNDLFINYSLEYFDITLGKKVLKMGPGYFSQLALSEQAPGLNVLLLKHSNRWFDYLQMFSYLGEGVNKQLFVHRLSSQSIVSGLEVGVYEAMMASSYIHPSYYIPLPIPYYLTKKLLGINNIYDDYADNYIGFDFSYTTQNKWKIYGEVFVDEFPQSCTHNHPDERAHLIGVYYPMNADLSLRTEYSNVFNYFYIHKKPQNNYVYKGEKLGHWIGLDGDVFDVELEKTLGGGKTVTLGVSVMRKGEGNFQEDWNPEYLNKYRFLVGNVKKTFLLKTDYKTFISNRISFNWRSHLGLEVESFGDNEFIWGLDLSLRVNL